MTPHTQASRYFTLFFMAVAITTSCATWAEEAMPWYVGASGGPTQGAIDDGRILQKLSAAGLPLASISDDNRDTAYKVFGGYRFSPNFALEASYFDLGKYGFAVATRPAGTLTGEARVRGMALDAVLIAPLTNKLRVSAKVGLNYAQTQDSFVASGAVTAANANPSQTELNPKIGFAMEYALTDALSVRADLERYRIHDAVGSRGDVDHLSVGLVYSWGLAQPIEPDPKPAPTAAVLQ